MKIRRYTIVSTIIIGLIAKATICMNPGLYYKIVTRDSPATIKKVTIGSRCDEIGYIASGKIYMDSLSRLFSTKTFDYNASLISFDDSCKHLAVVTNNNEVIIINTQDKATVLLPQVIRGKYTALHCCNSKKCLIGTNEGQLWQLKANKHPQLLIDYSITSHNAHCKKCTVVACTQKDQLYAGLIMMYKKGSAHMYIGDTKSVKKEWYGSDSGVYEWGDTVFNKDGSLVAFVFGNTVLIYVMDLLKKYQKIWSKNNDIYNKTIDKELEGMQRAIITYDTLVKKAIFYNDDKHIFAGLDNGKVYFSEITPEGKSVEVISFDESIASLAFNGEKLAVASLTTAAVYVLSTVKR